MSETFPVRQEGRIQAEDGAKIPTSGYDCPRLHKPGSRGFESHRRYSPFPEPKKTGRPRAPGLQWGWFVDSGLFWAASQFRWHRTNSGHWVRNVCRGEMECLHNWVFVQAHGRLPGDGLTVDHIDGNPSNNTLANLRPANSTLQRLNKVSSGVSPDRGRWRARVLWHLGMFSTREEALAVASKAKSEAIEREEELSWAAFLAQ